MIFWSIVLIKYSVNLVLILYFNQSVLDQS